LLEEAMSWNRAIESWDERDGYRMARIHDPQDQAAVTEALQARGARMVWLGAHKPAGSSAFQWLDGTPVNYQAWTPGHAGEPVIITEIQAKNNGTLRTSTAETPDWIELYNPGSEPVDLQNWRFMVRTPYRAGEAWIKKRDNGVSTIIPPQNYRLVLFGVETPDPKELSFSFNLEAKGALLRWCDPKGQVIQDFNRPWAAFEADTSIGCAENGTDWGLCEAPTPGAPNRRRVTSIQPPDTSGDVPTAILLMAENAGGWTAEMPQRRAWLLLERAP
ncbi:MAG TPA: hypothetical protein VD994_21325, partial [Prosthecobacter sp.]|nr:hypothetical protein [Prosthecobacter sp.]